MKRGEFVRLSLLAAIGLAVAPAIDLAPKLPALKQTYIARFKVSHELLEDKEMFNIFLDERIKSIKGKGNLVSTQIGFEGDDFIKNIMTVVLKFK